MSPATGAQQQTNPFLLVTIAMSLTGGLIALNKVSVWIAPAALVVAAVGMMVVAMRHRQQHVQQTRTIGGLDYQRLATLQVAHYLPWLKDQVRGQGPVIDGVFSELERNLRLANPGRTLGAFLLVGPTGTGKTFLAQLIAQALFPESKPVLLRMNQYKHSDDVYTLLGPPPGMPGYEVGGALTRPVLENPYRVVILDEIEKAHRDIQHCLYDILDAASCREKSSGRMVDFSGTVFFATCNAGVDELRRIRHENASNIASWQGKSREALVSTGLFERAFLARWTGIYLMDELSPMHIAEVACLQLARHWREYNIELEHASPAILLAAVEGNEEFKQYGVRQLATYLREQTKDAIIDARNRGATRVWLGVSETGQLAVTEFQQQ
jgi:ATP-dependent Clp protease ATP-binding subunit ClpC